MSWQSDFEKQREENAVYSKPIFDEDDWPYSSYAPLGYCDNCDEPIREEEFEYSAKIHGEIWCRRCIENANRIEEKL